MTEPKRRHDLLTDDGFQYVTIGEARQLIEDVHELQARLHSAHELLDEELWCGHGCKCVHCRQHLENVRLAKESK